MPLDEYQRRRDFSQTPEPRANAVRRESRSTWDGFPSGQRFCVQLHRASKLHFDFRMEWDGVLLSWAVPRGPSLNPDERRLAVHVEDHPVPYGEFEGVIPSGYGAGTVMVWDWGTYSWLHGSADEVEDARERGDIKFTLVGTKLFGEFALVRLGSRGAHKADDSGKEWLLIKKRDAYADPAFDAEKLDFSVKTGRTLDEIAAGDAPQQVVPRSQTDTVLPMLATHVDHPFSRQGWIFEMKYDGVRALLSLRDGQVEITGRHGRDETARYPEVHDLAACLTAHDAMIDAEIVVLDEEGKPSFEMLQNRINISGRHNIERAIEQTPVVFVVFDLLMCDGVDLTREPLLTRKQRLRSILTPCPRMLYAEHVERDGRKLFTELQKRGIEGMVGKRADSVYEPGRRSSNWVKVKSWMSQTAVICGFTSGKGRRSDLGALVLGVYDNGVLVHCGQTGTGFGDSMLDALYQQLSKRVSATTPLTRMKELARGRVTWVRPEVICEVRHAGWTSEGKLRHPVYLGLRNDLDLRDCVRETPGATTAVVDVVRSGNSTTHQHQHDDFVRAALDALLSIPTEGTWDIGGRQLHLTHLDKLMWPHDGITKRDLIAHYVRVAPQLLPHLRDRPLSMQVFPDGIEGKSFWRKDKPEYAPEWMESWTYRGEKTKHYIVVNEIATLAWIANAGVIDLHPWHSRVDDPLHPDWAVFDLDPFEPATFADVVTVAKLVKAALDHLHLRGYLKTSGQTGLQIYIPLARGPSYRAVSSWVEQVGRAIGQVIPERITWDWPVAKRTGKIRIDYTQNQRNKTLAAPYSVRPGSGAPVSTPLSWDELDDPGLRPDGWTLSSIGDRIAAVGDLFSGVLEGGQELPSGIAADL